MSEQQTATTVHERPALESHASWADYWIAQGMPWRTDPEISNERQQYLAQRRAVQPDTNSSIYPFRDVNGGIKLMRADLEWLIATHESGGMRGPVDWGDKKQRRRLGLDLRGAQLQSTDLSRLPLAPPARRSLTGGGPCAAPSAGATSKRRGSIGKR
jgi:hypothetical protein